MRTTVIRVLLSVTLGLGFISLAQAVTPEQIIAAESEFLFVYMISRITVAADSTGGRPPNSDAWMSM
jgi:hypothetical protein